MLKTYIKALRPRQWTKNLIVFAAPLFAFQINLFTFLGALLAVLLFCLTSSSFYLINDIVDVQADRQHPVKCHRPIASGQLPIPTAIIMATILLLGSISVGWWKSPYLGGIIICYALLQSSYNWRLKKIVILDVMAIAAGFVLRAVAGGYATNISISSWFLLCTGMLALFLAIEKRKAELRLAHIQGGQTRSVLKHYSQFLLGRMENVVTSGAIITYSLWCSGPKIGGASTSWMLLTVPFVLYGIFRYQLLSDPNEVEGKSERPEDILLGDRPILMTVVGWILTTTIILYLKYQGVIE